MSSRAMPSKLKIVVGLMVIGVVLSLLRETYLAAAFGGLLIFGVFKGDHTTRKYLIIVNVIGIVIMAVLIGITVVGFVLHPELSESIPLQTKVAGVATLVYGLLEGVFCVWCLQQNDVRDWMFRKSFRLDELGIEMPPDPPAQS
jgi:hypothetical protein